MSKACITLRIEPKPGLFLLGAEPSAHTSLATGFAAARGYRSFPIAVFRSSSPVFPADRVRLTYREKIRLGSEIIAAYLAVRWRLLRSGLPETVAAARNARPFRVTPVDAAASTATALRLGRGVEQTLGTLPFDSRCLIRSLVLVRILARRGLETSMVLGVTAKPGFTAHAWVEYEGIPLLPTSARFERLTEM